MSVYEAIADEGVLDYRDMQIISKHVAEDLGLDGKKVLLIIPDDTRTCPLNMVLRAINWAFKPQVAKLDMLIALGTHQPLSQEAIYKYLELNDKMMAEEFSKTKIYNHMFAEPAHLKTIGKISKYKMADLSHGLMNVDIDVIINKMIYDYDLLVVVGPTFPHEVVGFSGGNKYFFPGIAGQKVIDPFHWLGALITNRAINGTMQTPVRDVVDACADMIDIPKFCFSLVVTRQGLHGVFAGSPEEAYKPAAALSSKIHIRWCEKPFHTVLSLCPTMYPELWTGAKCMYKMEPVVQKGGKLIIYAPHMSEVSVSHGDHIKEIGYHTLPYFTAQMDKFKHIPGGVLAHSTHVKGSGTYVNGVETPDIEVILATRIPPEVCRQINLGYMDPDTIDVASYANREDEGILVVPHAGEVLHKLKP